MNIKCALGIHNFLASGAVGEELVSQGGGCCVS